MYSPNFKSTAEPSMASALGFVSHKFKSFASFGLVVLLLCLSAVGESTPRAEAVPFNPAASANLDSSTISVSRYNSIVRNASGTEVQAEITPNHFGSASFELNEELIAQNSTRTIPSGGATMQVNYSIVFTDISGSVRNLTPYYSTLYLQVFDQSNNNEIIEGESRYDGQSLSITVPAGTYTRILASVNLNFMQPDEPGGGIAQANVSYVIGGSPITASGGSASLSVDYNDNEYTAIAGDRVININAYTCIWPGKDNVVAGSQVNISLSPQSVSQSNSSLSLRDSQGYLSLSNNSFVLPANPDDAFQIYYHNVVQTVAPGDVFDFEISAAAAASNVELTAECRDYRVDQFAAPTALANNDGSTTLTWSAPADINSRSYDFIEVLACSDDVVACGQPEFVWHSSSARSLLPVSIQQTSFSASTITMWGAHQGGSWSPSTSYRYFISYVDEIGSIADVNTRSRISTATIAGGSSASAATGPMPTIELDHRPIVSASGQSLTLPGQNLTGVSSILVGGKEAKISSKTNGLLTIDVAPSPVGLPDITITHAGGTITMQGLIQVVEPYALKRTQKITKFVGDRPTLAGIDAIERTYLKGTTANLLTCVATVATDATDAAIAKAETRAQSTCDRVVKFARYIKSASVSVAKTGESGSKQTLDVTFDRTLTAN